MSEYQYYEWQTIDRPLTSEERTAVNGLSSHIEVTSTQAVVTYSWGNFKHDPIQVLEQYFDAFLYITNWGTKRLAFRFPGGLLDPRQIEPYLWRYCIELKSVGDYLILDILLDEEGGGEWVEDNGWLSSLSQLRDDLLKGDYRTLYLAWLRAAELQTDDDAEIEPPVPPGLNALSPPLTDFVALFDLDKYLLQAVAVASQERQPALTTPLEEAIIHLSPSERDDFLLRLVRGEPHLSLAINRRLQELTGVFHPPADMPRRTWGELWATADRLQSEAKRHAAEAAETKRIQELQVFALHEDEAWSQVMNLIEEKKPASYDKAVAILIRLRDLANYQNRLSNFQKRVADMQGRYANRPALCERLLRVRSV